MSKSFSEHTRWDAMLKMTKIKLELIPDPDLILLFEKGMRDIVKPTINIENLMTQNKNKNILFKDE